MAKHDAEEVDDEFKVGGASSNPAVLPPPHEVMLPEDMNEVKAVLSKGDPSLAFEDGSGAAAGSATTGDDLSMTYKCKHCVKTFPTRMALAQHKKKHAMLNRVLKGAGRKAKSKNAHCSYSTVQCNQIVQMSKLSFCF